MIAAIVIAASGLPVEGVRAQSADLSVQVAELYRQGRYREAIPIATRALQQDEAQFGIEHPSTATSLSHLASLYQSMGRYEDALPLYRRALAIREKVLGPEHPDTATSLDRLAWLYQSLGRYEDAARPPFELVALGVVFDNFAAVRRDLVALDEFIELAPTVFILAPLGGHTFEITPVLLFL
ncbi:tetratricopeptide repeat protein, partial [Candidatus Accumulibacter phosphatis]|nr:tetratricopeptide repeat protein [Candidatus Accumulibacter contiguus]